MFKLSWLHTLYLGFLFAQLANSEKSEDYANIYSPPAASYNDEPPQPPANTQSVGKTSISLVKTSTSILSTSTSSSSSSSGFTPSSDSSFLKPDSVPSSGLPTDSTVSSRTVTTTFLPLPTYVSSSAYIFPTGSASTVSQNGTDPNGVSTTACGQCDVYANEVRVLYWPTASVNTQCSRGHSISGVPTSPDSAPSMTAQVGTQPMKALVPRGGIDVIDGFTYTYPSTYFSVVGTIGVSNACSQIGKTLYNPPPIAVAGIKTASYAEWPSTCRPQAHKVKVVIDTLQLSDIACPTWGVSDPFLTHCDGEFYTTATVGWPYNPVIIVPPEVYNMDPAWGVCSQAAGRGELPCGVYDPPRALGVQQAMMPRPTYPSDPQNLLTPAGAAAPGGGTGVDSIAAPTAAPRQPETLMAPLPQVTKPGLNQDDDFQSLQKQEPRPKNSQDSSLPTPRPQAQSISDVNSDSDPALNNADSNSKSHPNTGAQSDPNAGASPQDTSDPKTQGDSSSSGAGSDDSGTGSDSQAALPAQKSTKSPKQAVPPRPIAQTTVAIGDPNSGGNPGGIPDENAGGGQSNNLTPSLDGSPGGSPSRNTLADTTIASMSPFTPHPVTVLGETLSAINPTAVVIASKTLVAGGSAFSTNGNFYSVGPSGSLVAGTLAPGANQLPALTFGNSVYTANSASQFVIGSQTLDPGQQITISGTPVSLASSSNIVVIGSSTKSLEAATPTVPPALLTFDGSTYTADKASQFVIGSQTLTPGGVITVSGTVISEAPSGSGLVLIGASTQVLGHPPTVGAPTTAAIMTFGGQTYTADASGNFVISGQTLRPGSMITVSGTPISEAPDATNVVIQGSIEVLSTATTSPSVMSFFGGASSHTGGAISSWTIWFGWIVALLSSTGWFLLGL